MGGLAEVVEGLEPGLLAAGPQRPDPTSSTPGKRLHWEAGALGQVLYLEAEAAGIRSTGIGCFFDDVVHELLGLSGEAFQTIYHFTVGGYLDDPRLRTAPPYDPPEGPPP